MNKIATQERNPASSVALSQSGSGSFLKAESLGDVVRFAELMCQSKAGIPTYLHGNAPDCMAVTMQALQWEFNPFSVAQKSYKIKDVIAYEAQLIAAVINTRADVKRRPQIEYRGEGGKRQCIVTFEFKDGSVQVYESPESERISPKNSPLWKTDPDQQLAYYSLRAGARRYCPEVILGAYDRDEVEEFRGPNNAKDITPAESPVMARLRANSATQEAADEQEGFSRSFVAEQTEERHDALTGEIIETQNAGEDIPAQPADDAATIPDTAASTEGDGIAAQSSSPSSLWLLNIARMLWAATNYNGDVSILKAQKLAAVASYPKPDDCPAIISGKAESVYAYCKQITEGSLEPADGLAIIAGVVGCDQDDLKHRGE